MTAVYVGSVQLHMAFMRGEDPLEWLRVEAFPEASFAGRVSQSALALALIHHGKHDEAAAMLDEVSVAGLMALPDTATWTVLAIWAEVTASLGNQTAAAEILERLDQQAGRLAGGALAWSSIDHARALLLLTLGDAAGAAGAAEAAVAASRRRGTKLFLGRELVVLAAARWTAGADEGGVRLLVDEAVAIADATGATIIRNDAARLGLLPS